MNKIKTILLALLLATEEIVAFSTLTTTTTSSTERKTHLALHQRKESKSPSFPRANNLTRRTIFTSILPTAFGAASFIVKPQPSLAKDELFKKNPLTNSLLEQMRILEQSEADNIKYGGELAPGSPKGREAYAKLLVPILTIQADLDQVQELVRDETNRRSSLARADTILSQPQFEKIRFKKIFNAFADNIYYSDPDRANAYLGGGAMPKSEQSIAYLLRNDVLTNVENLQAEVTYLIKEEKAGNGVEVDDLYVYSKACSEGMMKYLELVPPGEVKLAKEIFSS